MHTLAYREDIHDLHVAKIRFGGDIGLQPGTQRFAEQVSKNGKDNGDGNKEESPPGGSGSSNRRPGKGSGKKRSSGDIGSAPRMNSESAFTSIESVESFRHRYFHILGVDIAQQEISGRVGMSSHGDMMCTCKDMKRGMFERVVPSCFKYEGEI